MGRGQGSQLDLGDAYRPPRIDDLLEVPTEFRPLDRDGEWLLGGGCYYLAAALKDVFPEGKIAATWYSDHGRRALSHAVFYDPRTNRAWDGAGSWEHFQVALSGHDYIELETDADPVAMFEAIGLTYDSEAPFADDRMMDAWMFAERHFLPERFRNPDQAEDDF
jgi:hypothetical protein